MEEDMTWRIDQGDCRELMADMPDESFTACLCDPPYGLQFMGKGWDHGVPGVAYWAEVLRVMKPGGVLMAFGGTRTHHRLMVAIEDAGFEIFDTMMWLYGSGFPKSHDISKAINKAAGMEREVIGKHPDPRHKYPNTDITGGRYIGGTPAARESGIITAPATPDAATWQGYGTALKPAWEPIVLARKPRLATYAATALEHGNGALNIDKSRIRTPDTLGGGAEKHCSFEGKDGWDRPWMHDELHQEAHAETIRANVQHAESLGRWPANLLLSHSPGCVRRGERRVKGNPKATRGKIRGGIYELGIGDAQVGQQIGYADPDGLETIADWDCVPDCAVRLLAEQSGERRVSGTAALGKIDKAGRAFFGGTWPGHESIKPNDTGTAARFFKNFDPPTRFVYSAKASRSERDKGLEGMPEVVGKRTQDGGDDTRGRPTPRNRNPHPTVKPLAVTRYLATLLLPPEAYRDNATLLVPFAGVGSEMIGALRAGWRHVVGIELSEPYADMARRRIVADSPMFNG